MNIEEQNKQVSEEDLDLSFKNGEIFNATDEKLRNTLKKLSSGHVGNERVRHREIIRALTINTILNQRHIDRIESRNQKLTYIIIVLTVVSIVLSILSFLCK